MLPATRTCTCLKRVNDTNNSIVFRAHDFIACLFHLAPFPAFVRADIVCEHKAALPSICPFNEHCFVSILPMSHNFCARATLFGVLRRACTLFDFCENKSSSIIISVATVLCARVKSFSRTNFCCSQRGAARCKLQHVMLICLSWPLAATVVVAAGENKFLRSIFRALSTRAAACCARRFEPLQFYTIQFMTNLCVCDARRAYSAAPDHFVAFS